LAAPLRDEGVDGGELVDVAYARDPVEAELIKGLLENAGIPSLLQQARLNVDGPNLGFGLATSGFGGGPQRVQVHAEQAQRAKSLLADTLIESEGEASPEFEGALEEESGGRVRNYGVVGAYARAMGWSLVTLAVVTGIYFLLHAV
jgi:Putative prokaryotic signal transducing protein